MKLKFYLRGLGIGIFVTALILTIANHTKNKMTDNELLEEASKRGYSLETTADSLFEKHTTEAPTEDVTTEELTTEEETTEEETITEEITSKEETTPSQTVEGTITIAGGMYSSHVAAKLQEMGIVANAGEFDSYLESNGFSERIQTGTYNVKQGMSFEELARIITKS